MATTKAGQRAVNKYIRNNYDRLTITVPKGRKATIEAFANSREESVNKLTNRLYMAEMGLTEEEWKESKEHE